MVHDTFDGITIIFEKEFELKITPELKTLDLDDYNIKEFKMNFEHHMCGCCSGENESINIKPQDFFDFVNSGGYEKHSYIHKENKNLKIEIEKVKAQLKKYEDVIGKLKK